MASPANLSTSPPARVVSIEAVRCGGEDDGLSQQKQGGGTATLTSTIINLIKTTIGSGILSLPFAFAQPGFLLQAAEANAALRA